MKLRISRIGLTDNNLTEVALEHGGESLEWNISEFKNIVRNLDYDVFDQINQYWARMPPERQDEAYAVYAEIRDVFRECYETHALTRRLHAPVARLCELHPLEDIRHWIAFYSNLRCPDDVKDEFVPYEMPGTRDGTYVREEYEWLVALSIALRVIFPVWGEFIARIRAEVPTGWKEFYAWQLLAATGLGQSPPMERLRGYVEYWSRVGAGRHDVEKSAHVFRGISTEDYPTLLTALVLVRKLTIADVRGLDTSSNLVSCVFTFIRHKTRPGSEGGFNAIIKEKKETETYGQDIENQQSRLEACKEKMPVADGKIAPIRYYARDMRHIARQIAPDMPADCLEMSFESVKVLEHVRERKVQMTLTMYVLQYRKQLQPRALFHLPRASILQAFAVAQAVYWHKGYRELAALVSALPVSDADVMYLGSLEARSKIPAAMIAELERWFPYRRMPGGKSKTARVPTCAELAIDDVVRQLGETGWRLTLPPEWVAELTRNPRERHYAVPGNIRIKLAQLSIALASRSF
ncbi:hypothetical protein HDG34_003292 [Paraburkholderia sp. HC6.4b]|uniref:hypothetical protein n=1 Tax=unclassified Paraburkholderia TaxID=2615204 RepID=UPI00160A6DD5|nr:MULTISPECIES: hypothetical protein [unclassified Paraburkholderia]MBB5409351.1 hypothetical protein [Paraburkholderia sp. HC6.4b]MBB5451079.1 hypothetical protein [Paraburkholderia sp. Kb1A]